MHSPTAKVGRAGDRRGEKYLGDYHSGHGLGVEACESQERRDVEQDGKHNYASANAEQSGGEAAECAEEREGRDELRAQRPTPNLAFIIISPKVVTK